MLNNQRAFRRAGSAAAGYTIKNSVLISGDSFGTNLPLKRTPAVGNQNTWTFSTWVKLTRIPDSKSIFTSVNADAWGTDFVFNAGTNILIISWQDFGNPGSPTNYSLSTTQQFRDVSAWYHFVITLDNKLSVTEGDRARMYINGERVTDFSTENYPDGNDFGTSFVGIGTTTNQHIGSRAANSGLDGYLAETIFLDGTSLDATSFGEFDDNGIWVPSDLSELDFTGTNSFWLDFSDTGALGADNRTGPSRPDDTALLIHSNTTDGSTIFTDSSSNTAIISRFGNIEHSTTQALYGTSSIRVTSPTDYLLVSDSSAITFGSNDFTIKFDIFVDSIGTGNIGFFDKLEGAAAREFVFYHSVTTGGIIFTYWEGGTIAINPIDFSWIPVLNQWYNIALTKSGSSWNLYIDGTRVQIGTSAVAVNNSTADLRIGGSNDIGGTATYWLDEILIVNGTALYTGDSYEVPTKAYGSSSLFTVGTGDSTPIQTADSPTDDATDKTFGNFATMNPLIPNNSTLSNGNQTATATSSAGYSGPSTVQFDAKDGIYYFEVLVGTIAADGVNGQINNGSAHGYGISLPSGSSHWSWFVADAAGMAFNDIRKSIDGTQTVTNYGPQGAGSAYDDDDIVSVIYEYNETTELGELSFWKNGTDIGIAEDDIDELFLAPFFTLNNRNGEGFTIRMDPSEWTYTPPTGAKSVNTSNLPTPAIAKPTDHFQIILDSDGSNIKTASEALYTNQLVWIKDRENTNNHQLIDTVRGTTAVIQSNGITPGTTYSQPSGNSVAWVWNTGDDAVAGTGTTGTNPMISINQIAGFSIIKYTGLGGTTATINHGLTTAPNFILFKNITSPNGGGRSWAVYHSSVEPASNGILKYGALQTSGAFAIGQNPVNTPSFWQNINDTSFTVLTDGTVNGPALPADGSTNDHIAYCWTSIPGFSDFGSYEGNGSDDGPFIYTGFRPAWIMIKRTDAANNWQIYDSVRDPYNPMKLTLQADTTSVESGSSDEYFDFTANGFKIRDGSANWLNNSSGDYIYAAFAEFPFDPEGTPQVRAR